jgi:hypothetical protein
MFRTRALQSSRVELTWDEDDAFRSRSLAWERLTALGGKAAKKAAEKKGKGKKGRKGARGGENEEEEEGDDNLADLKA